MLIHPLNIKSPAVEFLLCLLFSPSLSPSTALAMRGCVQQRAMADMPSALFTHPEALSLPPFHSPAHSMCVCERVQVCVSVRVCVCVYVFVHACLCVSVYVCAHARWDDKCLHFFWSGRSGYLLHVSLEA